MNDVASAGFGISFFLLWAVLFFGGIIATIFWIVMLIDVVKRNFPQQNDKTLWVLIVVLAGFIGAIIYYVVIKSKDKKGGGTSIDQSSPPPPQNPPPGPPKQ